MKYLRKGMSISLVPDKISLYFEVTGCSLRCNGCHTPELREDIGTAFTDEGLSKILSRYKGHADVVVFLGGEASLQELTKMLRLCKDHGFLTCMFTGLPFVPSTVMKELTYIKTGPYVEKLGGLESKTTNQKFTRLSDGVVMNSQFWR